MNPRVLAAHVYKATPARRRVPFSWPTFLAGVFLGMVLVGLL